MDNVPPAGRGGVYSLTPEMEGAVVALLVDPKHGMRLLGQLGNYLRPDGFESPIARTIVAAVLGYFKRTKAAPTSTDLLQEVRETVNAGKAKKQIVSDVATYIEEARERSGATPDNVIAKIVTAARDAALGDAMDRASKLYGAGKRDEARLVLQRAVAVERRAGGAWRTPAERARALGTTAAKYKTGFGALDHACRGGFRSGGLVVLGGAPGAAKTTVAAQLALRWARAGHRVTFFAADEGADGILTRMGQSIDVARDDLEAGTAEAQEKLADMLEREAPRFSIVDAHEEDAAVDDAIEALLGEQSGGPGILFVDSVQAVRVDEDPGAEGPRARVDAVMRVLRSGARRGLLVVATSELARGAYRSRDAADRIDDLAAFKETGGIEYGADLAIVLRSVPGDGVSFEAKIAKNRWGQCDAFRLVLDRATATLTEVDLPLSAKVGQPDIGERVAAAIDLVRGELRAQPARLGKRTLRHALRGKAAQKDVDEAIATMREAGEIVDVGTSKNQPRWRLMEKQEGGPNGVLSS